MIIANFVGYMEEKQTQFQPLLYHWRAVDKYEKGWISTGSMMQDTGYTD